MHFFLQFNSLHFYLESTFSISNETQCTHTIYGFKTNVQRHSFCLLSSSDHKLSINYKTIKITYYKYTKYKTINTKIFKNGNGNRGGYPYFMNSSALHLNIQSLYGTYRDYILSTYLHTVPVCRMMLHTTLCQEKLYFHR